MTGQAETAPAGGRDGTLALLASRMSELGERVGELAARVDAAQAAIGRQDQAIAEAAGLAREVARLSEAIAAQQESAASNFAPVHPRKPVWAAMKDPEYADALRDLARWVATLLARHPHAREVLPPCWPAHRTAVEELDWLYWDWMGWAVGQQGRSRDAADWHDRWLPGVLARLGPELAGCARSRRHASPAHERAVPREFIIAGHPPEAVFIEQMSSHQPNSVVRARKPTGQGP